MFRGHQSCYKVFVDKAGELVTTTAWVVEMNIDNAVKGTAEQAACGRIFRDFKGNLIGYFACYLASSSSIHSKLMGVITAIDIATQHSWNKIQLKCDSTVVIEAFSSSDIVPRHIRNKWHTMLLSINDMEFQISHIFREGVQINLRIMASLINSLLDGPQCLFSSYKILFEIDQGFPEYTFFQLSSSGFFNKFQYTANDRQVL